jgi:hypothetical protein
MKKFMPYVIVLLLLLIIMIVFVSMADVQKMVVVKEGNIDKLPLKIKVKHYQDSDCGMVIESLTYASQAIAPDGKTWFFHDIGGMVNWISSKKFKDEAVMWVWAKDTNRWISHNRAWYSRDDITPMGYGFGAYENNTKKLIDYNTMSDYMLRGETMNNPYIRAKLLGSN